MKPKIDKDVVIIAILCITFLEAIAIFKGINGILLTVVIGVICAAAGIVIPKEKILRG